jgi:GAF domain-containing protein
MLLIVTLIRRLPYWLRAGSLLLLDYALAVADLAESGRGGDGRVFLLVAPVMAVLLFGWRAGVLALSLDVLVMGAFGWLFASGVLDIAAAKQLSYADPYAWASNTLVLIVLGVFATFSASFALSHLCSALDRGRDLVHELEKRDRTLDTRTRELERSNALLASRANALRLVAEVARDAVSAPSVPSMLARIVTMISESLGYYHCGIFCQDPTGEWAELIAASSGGGRRMLARHHRLRIRQEGIVGHVMAEGVPYVAAEAMQDPLYYQNPDLPDSRAELAVPLLQLGRTIGVIDVQATEAGAFSDDDVSVLQSLADLVVIAMQNTQSFSEVQSGSSSAAGREGSNAEQTWRDQLGNSKSAAYRYDRGVLLSLETPREGGTVLPGRGDKDLPELKLPIVIRDELIGTIDAHKAPAAGAWTAEELELVETVTEQLGMALDGARLYQDSQRRVVRERVLAEIGARMRETLDLEGVLQIAVREIAGAFEMAEVEVRMGAVPEKLQEPGSEEGGG